MLCSVTSPLVYTSMISAQYLQMQALPKVSFTTYTIEDIDIKLEV